MEKKHFKHFKHFNHFNHFKQVTVKYTLLSVAFAIAVSVLLMGPLTAHAAENEFPINTPLWAGPYDIFINPELNIAFPDTGAAYWSAKCTIPEGATLELVCKYAHARYISINSYDAVSGAPTDALNDTQIIPDPGSENPFLPGAKRNSVYNRDFIITILNELPPEDPADRMQNTLYAKAGDQGALTLAWRIYVMDKNRDITGGVGLPEPRVTMASGEELDTEASYAVLSIDPTPLPVMPMDPFTYGYLRGGYAWHEYAGEMPEYFPAQDPPDWMKTFDIAHTVTAWYVGLTLPTPPYKVAQYANLDNQYMSVLLDRRYGEVAVIRAKAPITPETYQRDPFMDGDFMDGDVDMRYWSITTNESLVTTKVIDGVYDEQVPLDDNGFYTIVVCLVEDRPSNAEDRYGVKWLHWGENGDGAGNLDDGHLILRHMLPSPGFEHAIQKVLATGDEESVLGEYFPEIQYMSTEEFEALGNDPGANLP
ncbi:MAG: hypothetical protein HF978_10120 [Desulfobacteraceae bacterium]|nr:hypothetical protein [Desulfobacteraceae bacterium]MBC2755892.1 hypothetical protein [Desulfobacteraceae bacterium]